MISRPALVLLTCSLFAVALRAQQSATPVPPNTWDPQAVSLLQKSLAVQVGTAQVTDVTLNGIAQWTAGSDDESGTATLMATEVGDSKLSLNLSSGALTEIRNHAGTPLVGTLPPDAPAQASQPQPVGAWSGPDGITHGMAGHNVMTDATWFFPLATLSRLADAPDYTISFIGPEIHDGQSVIHISVSQQIAQTSSTSSGGMATAIPPNIAAELQHLSQMEIYLNSQTLLPVALAFNAHPDNNALIDIPTEIQFSNYQAVNEIQVPFHVQRYLNGSLTLDLQFSSAVFNTGLTSSNFEIQ